MRDRYLVAAVAGFDGVLLLIRRTGGGLMDVGGEYELPDHEKDNSDDEEEGEETSVRAGIDTTPA